MMCDVGVVRVKMMFTPQRRVRIMAGNFPVTVRNKLTVALIADGREGDSYKDCNSGRKGDSLR